MEIYVIKAERLNSFGLFILLAYFTELLLNLSGVDVLHVGSEIFSLNMA